MSEDYPATAGVHEAVAESVRSVGGILRCETCRRVTSLGDVVNSLEHGWPMCCGHAMRWWSRRQVEAGEHRGPVERCPECGVGIVVDDGLMEPETGHWPVRCSDRCGWSS